MSLIRKEETNIGCDTGLPFVKSGIKIKANYEGPIDQARRRGSLPSPLPEIAGAKIMLFTGNLDSLRLLMKGFPYRPSNQDNSQNRIEV